MYKIKELVWDRLKPTINYGYGDSSICSFNQPVKFKIEKTEAPGIFILYLCTDIHNAEIAAGEIQYLKIRAQIIWEDYLNQYLEEARGSKMKIYTEKEMVAIMKPFRFSVMQILTAVYWSMFIPKKMYRLCWNLKRGMEMRWAFNDAKKWEEVK